jgi:hypothetical protein
MKAKWMTEQQILEYRGRGENITLKAEGKLRFSLLRINIHVDPLLLCFFYTIKTDNNQYYKVNCDNDRSTLLLVLSRCRLLKRYRVVAITPCYIFALSHKSKPSTLKRKVIA